MDEVGRTVWVAELAPDEVELADWPGPRRPSTSQRVLGVSAAVAGGLLALLLQQPGWVFLIVAGIVIYHGGRLPKPHP